MEVRHTSAGFGSGIERIMISMDDSFFEVDDLPNLTIISLTSEAWVKTNTLANTLREKNVVVVNASANKSFKSQMRYLIKSIKIFNGGWRE